MEGGFLVALISGWRPALVRHAKSHHEKTKTAYGRSVQVACKAVGAMRTIAVLTKESRGLTTFRKALGDKYATKNAFGNTLLYAVPQSAPNFTQSKPVRVAPIKCGVCREVGGFPSNSRACLERI